MLEPRTCIYLHLVTSWLPCVYRAPLQSLLQQTDARIADLKKEASNFKRNVVQDGEHHLTGAGTGGV